MPKRHRYQAEPFPVQVTEGGLAHEGGILSGDILLSVNGEPVGDFLEFYQQVAESHIELELLRKSEQTAYRVYINRTFEQPLGLIPNPPPVKDIVECENKCVFCFIHQQPKGLRRPLFIRDDDYRYSFSHGNFITLTNLNSSDWRRIYRERLSPLNISVHSTRPSIRKKLVVHPRAGRIRQQLHSLAQHHIEFHTQIVVCPGFNDGLELDHTLQALLTYWPHLLSISVVPIGLTRFRGHLPNMRSFTPELANQTISQIQTWQTYCLSHYEHPIVQAGDEMYWLAGLDYPPYASYGDFAQLEDGIGGARMFIDTFKRHFRKLPRSLNQSHAISILTGKIGASIIEPLIKKINRRVQNLQIEVHPLSSDFWGPTITVAGLLTGQDILKAAEQLSLGDQVWIPEIMVRNDTRCFLDDMTLAELTSQLGRPIQAIPERAESLIQAIGALS